MNHDIVILPGVGTGARPVMIGGAGVLGLGGKYPGVGVGPTFGNNGHEATLQHEGSLGSGTSVHEGGMFVWRPHLKWHR